MSKAQFILYRDTFQNGRTYCQTDKQWTGWTSFRAKLDTTTKTLLEVRINGSLASNSRVCKDQYIVRKLAQAMKNGVSYNAQCKDPNTGSTWQWEVTSSGTCAATGCTGSSTSDIVHFGCVPTTSGTGLCSCAGTDYWVFRHTIRNSNWGGIAGSTTCGAPNQWMELEFKTIPPFYNEAATTAIPSLDRCSPKQDLKARFMNTGKRQLDSWNYYMKVNTTVYGPYKAKIKLASQKDTLLTVVAGYTFTPNTTYNIVAWSSKPNNFNDSFAGNDTFKTVVVFQGQKGIPDARDTNVCGSQKITISATPKQAGDSLAWYADAQGKQFLGYGTKYTTPLLSSGTTGKTYKFYCGSYNGFVKNFMRNTYSYVYYGMGNMFDLTPLSNDLIVDSIRLNVYAGVIPVGNQFDCDVYIRDGSYTASISSSTGWTRIYRGRPTSMGSQQPTMVPVSWSMKKGQTYGIYIDLPGNGLLFDYTGGATYTNADLRLQTGTVNNTGFGAYTNGYDWDGDIYYRYPLCPSPTDSSTVVVKPTPFGAYLDKGTPFQTSPKKSGAGVKGSPHVVAMGDTLAFNLMAPTNFPNSTYGTGWKMKNVMVRTLSGRVLSSYTWSDPVGGSSPVAGRLAYTPTTTEIDSVVYATLSFQDLGPYNCDTVINHYIYVAPLPEPSFTRTIKVCDGDVVSFNNTSKIKSGYLEYKWRFGTGDTSEASDPVYAYPTYGTYYPVLEATSGIYGYMRSRKDTLIVTQIPKVAFKVTNACEKQTHQFTNQTTVLGGTLSYKWDFGDGSPTSTATSPSHKYTAPAQYKVTLTASANGCAASLTKNAYLFPKPKALFTYPTGPGVKFCTNNGIQFNDMSTVSSGSVGQIWSFGDGQVATDNSPKHKYANGGTYNVRDIAITEFGCADTMIKSITVNTAPVVSFTHGQVCDLTPTQFTNTTPAVSGTVSNTKWTFGDGSSSTANSPAYQYGTLGPKNVKLIVSLDNGCVDSASQMLSVGTQPSVDFSVQNTCSGKPVQFENKTTYKQGSITYKWNFGDNDSTTLADPSKTYNVTNSTTYNVTLVATVDGVCSNTTTKPVTVFELPNSNFTITDDWTPGDGYRTVKVTAADATLPFYRYQFSDGGSMNTSSGLYQFAYEGDFTITLCTRNQADCESCKTLNKSIRNVTGVNDITGGQVKLYPNPSNGVVNVEATSNIVKLEVFNVLGETTAASQKLNGNNATLNFGSVAGGVYLVKVTTDTGITTRRITINK
ncbi:MAG: PKD domain-containing protein [Bacteroidetes bacterium]|nr:PKD domain-containing protein [Bacteroidota bacterium]